MSCNCAQNSRDNRIDYQYAVKIVCGTITTKSTEHPLPLGEYKTKINVHNFSRCECVTFRWKVAIGFPHSKVGPASDFLEATLCADEALEIDCSDIKKRIAKDIEHAEGWVVIESPLELDVVAVYGTSELKDGTVNAFHTERVHPRCLAVCDDFDLNISTGVAAWEVREPGTAAVFNVATLSGPAPGWNAPQAGSIWVRPGSIEVPGKYTYKLNFKLCSGFKKPNLQMNLLAAHFIESVSLNGHQILPSQAPGPSFNITPITCSTNQFFKTGINELIIIVNNPGRKSSPTGLNVYGFIEVANGLCAGEPYPLLACPKVCYQVYDAFCTFNPFTGMFTYLNPQIQSPVCQGTQIGSTGGFRRIEMLSLSLAGSIPPGTYIEYRVYTQKITSSGWSGWAGWSSAGFVGITGANYPITAIEIRLVNAPVNCHVRYSIWQRRNLAFPMGSSTQSIYFYDGATAGDAPGTFPYHRIEALNVEIV